ARPGSCRACRFGPSTPMASSSALAPGWSPGWKRLPRCCPPAPQRPPRLVPCSVLPETEEERSLTARLTRRPGGAARLRALLESGQMIVAPGAFEPLAAREVDGACV